MARTILKVAEWGTGSAWLLWIFPLATMYVLLRTLDALPEPIIPEGIDWWYLPLTLIGSWIITSVGACLTLTGRSTLILKLLIAIPVICIGSMIAGQFAFSPETNLNLQRLGQFAGGVAVSLITFALLIVARRRQLLGWATVYVALSVWIGLAAALTLGFLMHPPVSYPWVVLIVGGVSLAVAPLAAAPLALAWNRNR